MQKIFHVQSVVCLVFSVKVLLWEMPKILLIQSSMPAHTGIWWYLPCCFTGSWSFDFCYAFSSTCEADHPYATSHDWPSEPHFFSPPDHHATHFPWRGEDNPLLQVVRSFHLHGFKPPPWNLLQVCWKDNELILAAMWKPSLQYNWHAKRLCFDTSLRLQFSLLERLDLRQFSPFALIVPLLLRSFTTHAAFSKLFFKPRKQSVAIVVIYIYSSLFTKSQSNLQIHKIPKH